MKREEFVDFRPAQNTRKKSNKSERRSKGRETIKKMLRGRGNKTSSVLSVERAETLKIVE